MEAFFDATVLARLQFAGTVLYHFMFVPLSIGFGMILVILQTKAYKTKDSYDEALARFWVRLFAGTFAVGVATGITLEFSFGTNWADYSRFVGDIFGAPLAAEALFAFFLESVFLGVLLYGKNKVSAKFYMVSSWLVWFGSCLSALWIIIANSWMQTPAGYEVVSDGVSSKAILTDFFNAALNPSTLQRYFHVLVALFITGALVCLAIGAYYKLKNKDSQVSSKLIKIGAITGVITVILMLPAAHMQAVVVVQEQPAKLAAMEGQYQTQAADLSIIGWVDENNQELHAISIPGFTSFLASWDFNTEYPGLNDFPADEVPSGINAIYQVYHLMVALIGVIGIVVLLGLLVWRNKLTGKKWPLRIMLVGPIASILAIQMGWLTAELGRQPWIVYGELKTADAASLAVDPWMLIITLLLFLVVYTVIYIAWWKTFAKAIKEGPEKYLTETEVVEEREEGVLE